MFDKLKEYLNDRIEYTKLEVVDLVSNMISVGVFGILIGMFLLLILIIASVAFGFLLGDWMGNDGLGFLTLFGFYLLIFIMLFVFRKQLMVKITDKVVATAMDALDNSNDDENEK